MRVTSTGTIVAMLTLSGAVAHAQVVECNGPEDLGNAAILATAVNPPGFPEGIAVRGDRFYVAGPATFGTTGRGPSKVLAFDRATGALEQSFDPPGENLLAEHANSCLAFDKDGLLYVLNTQLGTQRLDPATGTWTTYATPFPDLHPCVPVLIGPPCSPTVIDGPPIPNDIAFDPAGNAYVTDSLQATIWRIPAGGGSPEIWFQDMRLASPYIGVNGLRVHPDGTRLFLTVTTDLLGQAWIYTLPVGPPPAAASLATFHQFAPGEGPDGIAFGAGGDLYVTLALPLTSGILVLDENGTEVRRFTSPLTSPFAPYDSPANLAFDGAGRILVTNHAFVTGLVLPSQFSVSEVCVNDLGAPLFEPDFTP